MNILTKGYDTVKDYPIDDCNKDFSIIVSVNKLELQTYQLCEDQGRTTSRAIRPLIGDILKNISANK